MFRNYYASLVTSVVNNGFIMDSRIGPAREVLAGTAVIHPYIVFQRPGFSWNFAIIDALQAIAGYFDRSELEEALGHKMRIPYNTASAWGPYLKNTLSTVIYQLLQNPESRRCTVHFGADRPGEQEKPCCSLIQFIVRRDLLYMVVDMRSWDLGVGFLYDIIVFQVLMAVVASALSVKPGLISITAGSAHVYQKDIDDKRFGEPGLDTQLSIEGNQASSRLIYSFPELDALEPLTFRVANSFAEEVGSMFDSEMSEDEVIKHTVNLQNSMSELISMYIDYIKGRDAGENPLNDFIILETYNNGAN